MTEPISLAALADALTRRAAWAVLNLLSPRSPQLREHLRQRLEKPPGHPDGFLADPVIEATFGWQQAAETMEDLTGELLTPRLVRAMDQPPAKLRAHRFEAA